jgi:hypothetical protein
MHRCQIGDQHVALEFGDEEPAAKKAMELWSRDYRDSESEPSDLLIRIEIADVKQGFYALSDRMAGINLPELAIDGHQVSFKLSPKTFKSGRWGVPYAYHVGFLGGMVAGWQGSSKRVVHGAAVELDDGQAVLITGPSGAGKSTLSRVFGPKQLGDEAVVVRVENNKVQICGTPIPGEQRAQDCAWRELVAIVVPGLHHAEKLRFMPLKSSEIARVLLGTTVCLRDAKRGDDLLWIDQLTKRVPSFRVDWWKERAYPRQMLMELLNEK